MAKAGKSKARTRGKSVKVTNGMHKSNGGHGTDNRTPWPTESGVCPLCGSPDCKLTPQPGILHRGDIERMLQAGEIRELSHDIYVYVHKP